MSLCRNVLLRLLIVCMLKKLSSRPIVTGVYRDRSYDAVVVFTLWEVEGDLPSTRPPAPLSQAWERGWG
jgi:hypothetical protein